MSNDLRTDILEVLASSAAPKSSAIIYAALPRRDRPALEELRTLLTDMTASGSVIMLSGTSEVFVAAPIEAWARAMLLEQVLLGAKSEAKLKQALTQPHEHLFADAISVLKSEGRVFEHLSLTQQGQALYATVPIQLLNFIAKDLDKLVSMATMRGFSTAEICDTVLRHLTQPASVEIEVWKEPPLALVKSSELRTDRAFIVNGLALTVLFLASLAFFGRHELSAMAQPSAAQTAASLSVPVNSPNKPPPRAPTEIEAAIPQTYLPHSQAVNHVPPVLQPVVPAVATPDPAATADEAAIEAVMTMADAMRSADAVTTPGASTTADPVANADSVTPAWVPKVEEALLAPGADGLPVR